ncbi:hypothetical protein [Arcticibacter tournemirensis]|uniref:hypothetical protein n=1 Tax=Arcticibacter tournemirensis TaxID=699437 RepID=UPI001386B56B|nr:hypothetical protein [Arcticibacter tournemirensis]
MIFRRFKGKAHIVGIILIEWLGIDIVYLQELKNAEGWEFVPVLLVMTNQKWQP